jgi:hypothetical protein
MHCLLKKMIFLTLQLSLVGLLLFNCQKESAAPEDILASNRFVPLLIDFYLAEAKLNNLSLPVDSVRRLFMPIEDSVLKKHGVSDSLLKKTYQYYFEHPKELEKVYEIVVDSLSLMERKSNGAPASIR